PTLAIQLYKKIPSGAGLGGGSADAAFTLTTINRLCNLHLSNEKLAEIAATLGSDCPFFIYNKPMLASGRGEILKEYPIDLSNYKIELTTPPVAVSTKEAYAGIAPKRPEIALADALQAPIENWKELIKNDFELSVFAKYPQIAALKEQYYKNGAVYASMSGSGSTVYGIFAN
ncbi:MAG: 4-(cytidine 5'-diphospho)-2-C-methyl-D-erythritol kinase, partial [Bacteroidales bacterium]|nr:4-(cytidine 5'-diphospho)-2-C-methyl-D-erythritol kinase [Bacteroidales bacterium]